jgi:hypothetical protein
MIEAVVFSDRTLLPDRRYFRITPTAACILYPIEVICLTDRRNQDHNQGHRNLRPATPAAPP